MSNFINLFINCDLEKKNCKALIIIIIIIIIVCKALQRVLFVDEIITNNKAVPFNF